MTNSDDDKQDAWDEMWDTLEENYAQESDGIVKYDVEASEIAETLYKISDLTSDDSDSDWVVEMFTLMRLYNSVISTIDEIEGDDNWEDQAKLLTSDDVMLFFTLADEVVSGVSGDVLDNEIVTDGRRGDSSLESMRELDHYSQMDLLYYSGEINSGLKGELTNIHKTRNKLTHDLRQRHYLEGIDNLESRLDRALEAINKLHEISAGYQVFEQ